MAFALPLPIGVTARSLPDRLASVMSGAYAKQSAVAGQASSIGIYNNATDGTVLRIYGVSLFVSGNTFIHFEWIPGNPGTLYTQRSPFGVIDPRSYTTPGQPITFTSSLCVGQHAGGIAGILNGVNRWAPGWPLAIIPPTYSFLLQTDNQQIQLEGGMFWLPVPGPFSVRV